MSAKVNCKKGYNTKEGYVEFKKSGTIELCPVSNSVYCERCEAKPFKLE
jgi:hypothetical protein